MVDKPSIVYNSDGLILEKGLTYNQYVSDKVSKNVLDDSHISNVPCANMEVSVPDNKKALDDSHINNVPCVIMDCTVPDSQRLLELQAQDNGVCKLTLSCDAQISGLSILKVDGRKNVTSGYKGEFYASFPELSVPISAVDSPDNGIDTECVSLYRVNPIIPSICPIAVRTLPRYCIGGIPCDMNIHAWEYYLHYKDDDSKQLYLKESIKYGFAIVDPDTDIPTYFCDNYKSVTSGDSCNYIHDLIASELTQGKFVISDMVPKCVHALGAIPKGDGTYRPITDCKRPLGLSINNFMTTTHQPFNYVTTDQVSDNLSPNCYMATTDISSAYRSVSIRHDHWDYQGLTWPGADQIYLKDTRMCFGLRCAPYCFTAITEFVVRTMNRLGFAKVSGYIDDFIVFGETEEECLLSQCTLMSVLGDLGFSVSWRKCCPPSQKVRYLGIDFDSKEMTLSLPTDKLEKLHSELEFFKGRGRATKKQLQRLCGIIAHCSKVIRGGRTFSRRLIDLLSNLGENNPRIRLTSEFQKDIQWWISFAAIFNGKEKIISPNFGDGPIVHTDSCLKGYGLLSGVDWQAGYFNTKSTPQNLNKCCHEHEHWSNLDVTPGAHISFLELIPILQALLRYREKWSDQHVLCMTDNTQVVSAINKGTNINVNTMSILRQIFWICVTYNIYLCARHIPGVENVIPDMLSHVFESDTLDVINDYSICCSGTVEPGSGAVPDNFISLVQEYESS